MREFIAPLAVTVDPRENLSSVLATRLATGAQTPIISRKVAGAWTPMTVREFHDQVVAVAKGFVAHGMEPGDRVGIMSRTRYEWTLLDFAAWYAGVIPVPLYETSSAEQVQWILTDSGVRLLVVETPAHADVVGQIRADAPALGEVLIIDDGAIDALIRAGAQVQTAEIERRRTLAAQDDLATIIYTSGTTGRPKGAELTHRNFVSLSTNTIEAIPEVFADGGTSLLFMPLAHVFARFIEVLVIQSGMVLAHTPDTRQLVEDLGTYQPTFVLSVPRVFEKVYNSAEQKAAQGGKRRIFHWAVRVAITYSRSLDTGGPSLWLKAQQKVADTLVFAKIKDAMGGKIKWAVSGGAPLGERLGHFFRGMGVQILEGYGLTETTAPTCVNRPSNTRVGTVGLQIPGCGVRIADDGEVLLKGHGVFRGYHNNPTATAEALVDEWFHTGDIGSLDDDGFLSITGRKKEIIVTAGGKNVAPAVLEDRIRAHALVSQCVVVGDQKPFIAALITLDPEGIPGWCAAHGKPELSVGAAATDPDVLQALDAAVTRANRAVSKAESIRKFTVLTDDFTVANGYLTPSLKVKRAVVLHDFATQVEAIYTPGPASAAK